MDSISETQNYNEDPHTAAGNPSESPLLLPETPAWQAGKIRWGEAQCLQTAAVASWEQSPQRWCCCWDICIQSKNET